MHPSDPWPLPGHPEAMKKSYRRDYFHTSAWKGNSAKFVRWAFSEIATVFRGPPCGERDIADTRRRTVPPPLEPRPASLVFTLLVARSKAGKTAALIHRSA